MISLDIKHILHINLFARTTKFSNYNFINEVYSIGFMLVYIFTGKKNIENLPKEYLIFKEKFITNDLNKRFNNIDDIINMVKRIN